MKPKLALISWLVVCIFAFSCAKTQKVENVEIEELKRRQTELEASQGRVLQELDRIKTEILVLEEVVNSLKGGGQIKGEGKIEPSLAKPQSPESKPAITAPTEYNVEELKRAENLIKSGKSAEAIFLLLDAEPKIKTDKDRCQQGYLMARAYSELTEWQQALKWAESIDKNTCQDIIPKAKLIKVEALIKLGRTTEAKKVLNLLLTEYPDSEEAKKAKALF